MNISLGIQIYEYDETERYNQLVALAILAFIKEKQLR